MPTVFIVNGYRFFFYSNEGDEPPHVHVEKADAIAKFWLKPVRLGRNSGFKKPQLRAVRTILKDRQDEVIDAWRTYFQGD